MYVEGIVIEIYIHELKEVVISNKEQTATRENSNYRKEQ
jgi:hypothetical protein